MIRTIIHTHDPVLKLCYTPEEAEDLFGQAYIDEFGTDLPKDLVEDVTKTYSHMLELSEKLRGYKK